MTDNKRLAFSIIQFLHDQLQSGDLTSGAQESLEGEKHTPTEQLETHVTVGYMLCCSSHMTAAEPVVESHLG